MNIYEKINKARVMYQELGVKMSGHNKYAGYQYYELSDITPQINVIAHTLGFTCEVSFSSEIATLTMKNTEKIEDVIIFTCPMSTASLKGCHEVQNLGAVITYIKRYLYQNCFEIVEADSLNAMHNPNDEYAILSEKLEKLIDEKKFNFPENVKKIIKEKNIEQMKKALESAQK